MSGLGRRNSKYDAIAFDLDGTLWDTCHACAVAWNRVQARNRIAFREITHGDVRAVTGRPHEQCIRTAFAGLPEAQLRLLTGETTVEEQVVISGQGGELYAGVGEGLARLARDHRLFIVSNCPRGYIETFLDWSGMG